MVIFNARIVHRHDSEFNQSDVPLQGELIICNNEVDIDDSAQKSKPIINDEDTISTKEGSA